MVTPDVTALYLVELPPGVLVGGAGLAPATSGSHSKNGWRAALTEDDADSK